DRNLTPVGKNNSRELGEKIKKSSFHPDFVLASPAVRASETVENINQLLALPKDKIQFETLLYEGLTAEWLDAIHEIPDSFNVVMLVGHNPGISILASALSGQKIDLDPCELICFELSLLSWK